MRVSRRTILLAGPAAAAFLARPLRAESASVLTVVLAVDGPATVSRQRAIAAFIEKRLPIGLSITGSGPDSWASLAGTGGLVELVAEGPDVADQPRYAQMRAAGMRREELLALGGETLPARSLLLRDGIEGIDLPAFRVSQFRVLMAPGGGSAAVEDRMVGRGQLLMAGGVTLDTGSDLVAQVEPLLGAGGSWLAILPLPDGEGDWLARVEALANRLDVATRQASVVMVRPMDHLLQSGAELERNLAILIDGREEPARARAFRAELAALDVPATVCLTPRDAGGDLDGLCLALDGAALLAAERERDLRTVPGLLVAEDLEVPPDFSSRLVVHPPRAGASGWTGIAADGRLHARAEAWPEGLDGAGPLEDGLLMLSAADIATGRQREAVTRAILDAAFGDTRLWELDAWARHLVAPDVLHDRYLAARARGPADGPRHAGKPDGALIRDARTAWGYIARNTLSQTGHAIPTLATLGGRVPNMDATLWDVGSQIFGTLAAAHLGLIDTGARNASVASIVENIPTITIGGARLPPAVFDVRTLRARQTGFDVCDLGRFLLALDKAVGAGALTAEARDRRVASWDVEASLEAGRFRSYRNRRWDDVTVSHCTDYVLPAFRTLGFDLPNIYLDPAPGLSDADRDLANLAVAAAAGPIGTEPILLSLVEGSASAAAEALERVLLDAQAGHFEAGGSLRAVSETPLDRAPWFTYEGLALDIEGPAAWSINPIDRAARYQTEDFRREAEVVVAKAAYLWRAVRRDPWTDALVRYVREGCREEEGFCVGIYARSGAPMTGYYDINTNGIILTALAAMVGAA